MELKQIKELMAVMQRTGTKRLVIKREDVEVELEREDRPTRVVESTLENLEDNPLRHEMALHRANLLLARAGEHASAPATAPRTIDSTPAPTASEPLPGTFITSPMVGTLYASPSPGEAAFVKVGDKVEKGSVVCIIEAMKVMNEVKAGINGTVAEILVENGHPVEFGTKLIRIV